MFHLRGTLGKPVTDIFNFYHESCSLLPTKILKWGGVEWEAVSPKHSKAALQTPRHFQEQKPATANFSTEDSSVGCFMKPRAGGKPDHQNGLEADT